MKLDELVDRCIKVQRKRLGLDPGAPVTPEEREAMASVLETAAAYRPGVMAHIEESKGRAVADQIRAKRRERDLAELEALSLPVIREVAAEASEVTGGEVTAELLTGSCDYPWLTPWRDLCWWSLSRKGMRTRQIGAVFGCDHSTVVRGIDRHNTKLRTARDAGGLEVSRAG